jgi:hypothetical protein
MRMQMITRALTVLAVAGLPAAGTAYAQSVSGERALLNRTGAAAVEPSVPRTLHAQSVSGEHALLNQVGAFPVAAALATAPAGSSIDPVRALTGRMTERCGFQATSFARSDVFPAKGTVGQASSCLR